MSFWDRVKSSFIEAPWSMGLTVGSLAIWILAYYGITSPMTVLGGALDVAHAWRWITFPLSNPVALRDIFWFAIAVICSQVFFAGPLERGWGGLRFGRIVLVINLATALAEYLTYAIVERSMPPAIAPVAGLTTLLAALVIIWAGMNRGQTIMLNFIVPVRTELMAALTVVFLLFDERGGAFGLADALVGAACWWWAVRYAEVGGSAARPGKKASGGLRQWWNQRRRDKRKGRFQVLDGGSTMAAPVRIGSLQSLSKTPLPKHDEPSEKELDRILDKIRVEGMAALTEKERAALDAQSRRLRGDT
jgi:hypothetical protein